MGNQPENGVVHFSSHACRHANASFRIIQDALANRGIPLLVLEGDMSDERNYSTERTAASLIDKDSLLGHVPECYVPSNANKAGTADIHRCAAKTRSDS